jgi:three-Cys-motif partner protein
MSEEADAPGNTRTYAVPLNKAAYAGREQTLAKHFFLRRYLQALAFKLLQANPTRPFLYIDAFSGPWRSGNERREDTSFCIALNVLSDVVEQLRDKGLNPTIRAVFVENDRHAYGELKKAVEAFPLVKTTVFHGKFESKLPEVVALVGDAFAFTFVDPTGWSGMPLPALTTLLRGRQREVLVNLMAYAIGRHVADARELVRGSFNTLFGDERWWDEYAALKLEVGSGEAAFRRLYLQRLRATCGYRYVTTTRILWPGKRRTYFYLAYGTNSPSGIAVFRQTEKACVSEQEEVARDTLGKRKMAQSGMDDLFAGTNSGNEIAFRAERQEAINAMAAEFDAWIRSGVNRTWDDLLATLMQRPLVYPSDCVTLLKNAEGQGRLTIDKGMKPSERLLRPSGSPSSGFGLG